MASMFIDTLPSPFYDKVIGSVASNFADLVTIGERIETGIKQGRFAQDLGNASFVKKVEKQRGEANTMIIDSSRPQGQGKIILSSSGVSLSDKHIRGPEYPPDAPKEVLPLKPLERPYPKIHNPNAKCDYHSGAVGHSTERCWSFKHKVQDLIDVGWLRFKGNESNINTNPLPTHKGQSINTLSHDTLASDKEGGDCAEISKVAVVGQEGGHPFQPLIIQCDPIRPTPLILATPPRPTYKNNHVVPWKYDLADSILAEEITNIAESGGMTRSGRIYTPENLGKKNPKESPKKTLKEKEAEEFLKLIRYSEYELLDHMNKTPTLLNEAHIALDITAERFGGIVSNLTRNGRLTFSDEEIPMEGRQHNQPLHISVKCGNYMITKVIIDNSSSLNVLPKSTIDKLSSVNLQLKASTVVVRAFDGSTRDVMG
ncbi:hypothetical protein CR513_25907, partial [Mucuna pruriens]